MEQLVHPVGPQNASWQISRRMLLKGAGTLLAGALGLAAGLDLLGRPTLRQPRLQRSTFARHMGEQLRVDLGPQGSLALALLKVQALAAGPADDEHSFSITLSGSSDRVLPQGTYNFSHDRIGAFPLFIVPIGPASSTRHYEAIFNRLAS